MIGESDNTQIVRNFEYLGSINNEADVALLQGDLKALFDWLCQCVSRPASIVQEQGRENAETSLPAMAEQEEAIQPRYTLDALPRPSMITIEELSPNIMVFNALRTGKDYFYDFVRYLVASKDAKAQKAAFDTRQKQIEPITIYHRLIFAICGALKTIAEDIKRALFDGVALYWCEEDPVIHGRLGEYRGSLLFVQSELTLYAVSPEGEREALASYESVEQFEDLFPPNNFTGDSALREALNIQQQMTCVRYEQIQTLMTSDNKIPGIHREDWTPEQWHQVLNARLQQLNRTVRHYFRSSGFSVAFSKEDNKRYFKQAETLFLRAIHYYVSHDENSFWLQVPSQGLALHVQAFYEKILWANFGAVAIFTQIAFNGESDASDLRAFQSIAAEPFLLELIAPSSDGTRFMHIPHDVRTTFDLLIANKKGIEVTALTDAQREKGYRKYLEQYFGSVPLNARDPEKNSLALLAVQYGNTKLFKYLREADEAMLVKRNHRNLSAVLYMQIDMQLVPSVATEPSMQQLQSEESKKAVKLKDPLGDELRKMEIFVRGYLESWVARQKALKIRADSNHLWDQLLENLSKAFNILFKTRDKFDSRKEQAEQCLAHIMRALRSKNVEDYCRSIEGILDTIELERGRAKNSILYKTFSNSVRTLKGINEQNNIEPDDGDYRESSVRASDCSSIMPRDSSCRSESEASMIFMSSQPSRSSIVSETKENSGTEKVAVNRADQLAVEKEAAERREEAERAAKEAAERREKAAERREEAERVAKEAAERREEAERAEKEKLLALLKKHGISPLDAKPDSETASAPALVTSTPSAGSRSGTPISLLFASPKLTQSDSDGLSVNRHQTEFDENADTGKMEDIDNQSPNTSAQYGR